MTVLLQVSDTHFGTERPVAMAALRQLCTELRPDLLLVTGDITQRARRGEFERARAFFDALAVPARLIVPGNHDIPLYDLATRLLSPYRGFERVFGTALEGEFERDDLLVIALNTTRRWRHSNGEVSRAQVARVAERLARARPAQLKLVAVHQPVAAITHSDVANLLRGRHHALKRWAAAGADAVVGGHIHLPYVLPLRERWPELPREIWAVQAGTAVSSRLRGGISNSVNVIRAAPAASVQRWDLDEAQGCFQLVQATQLR